MGKSKKYIVSELRQKEVIIMGIKGYKVFNSDWTCKGFQYKVGETYIHNGNIKMCGSGFHFCQKASDCFSYYQFDSNNKVAEIEAIGIVETSGNKSVTDKIVIVREIPWQELLTIVNEGKDCTGLCNTGNCNTGDRNTGDRNTGDRNTGKENTGDRNTGDRNTGDWNSTNFSSGIFNSVEQPLYIFNLPTKISRNEIRNHKGIKILDWNFENSWWIYSENMSDEEKSIHPEHEATGGYLKTVDFKPACKMMWDKLSDDEKQCVKEIPNFNAEVFKEITGIEI